MVVARPVISHQAAPPSRPDPVPAPHQGSAESKRPGGPAMAVPKSAPPAAARKAAGPSVAAGRKYSDRSDGGEEKQMVSTKVRYVLLLIVYVLYYFIWLRIFSFFIEIVK